MISCCWWLANNVGTLSLLCKGIVAPIDDSICDLLRRAEYAYSDLRPALMRDLSDVGF